MIDPYFPDGHPPWAEGYLAAKRLDGDEWLCVIPGIFGARLAVCTPTDARVTDWSFTQPSGVALALEAWAMWPETPKHWTRHITRDQEEIHP